MGWFFLYVLVLVLVDVERGRFGGVEIGGVEIGGVEIGGVEIGGVEIGGGAWLGGGRNRGGGGHPPRTPPPPRSGKQNSLTYIKSDITVGLWNYLRRVRRQR